MARDFTYEPEGTHSQALARQQPAAIAPVPPARMEPVSLRDSTWVNAGTARVTKAQAKILLRPPDPLREVYIKPSGEVYPPHIAMRRRLTEAFGPMGWALRPISEIPVPQKKDGDKSGAEILMREYQLVAEGRVIAAAWGSGKYYGSNARMDYSDVAEALKSDALKRCCKDLTMFSELWDSQWCEDWRNEHAVHVYVAEKEKSKGKLTGKVIQNAYWRRIDAKPFPGELEPVRDSPNRSEWRRQMGDYIAHLESETAQLKEVVAKLKAARRGYSQAAHEVQQHGGNPQAAHVEPEAPSEPAREEPEAKPDATRRDERPPTIHSPRGVNTDDKPYLILSVKKTQGGKGWVVEMLNGQKYYTFSDRVKKQMDSHWAARDRILIQFETKRKDGREFREITEWQIMKDQR